MFDVTDFHPKLSYGAYATEHMKTTYIPTLLTDEDETTPLSLEAVRESLTATVNIHHDAREKAKKDGKRFLTEDPLVLDCLAATLHINTVYYNHKAQLALIRAAIDVGVPAPQPQCTRKWQPFQRVVETIQVSLASNPIGESHWVRDQIQLELEQLAAVVQSQAHELCNGCSFCAEEPIFVPLARALIVYDLPQVTEVFLKARLRFTNRIFKDLMTSMQCYRANELVRRSKIITK